MIGSKAEYRRDDFIMERQSRTPWIKLEKTAPLEPIWPYIVGGFCAILLAAAALILGIANWQ